MARSNEFKLDGGAFENLSDAMRSLDDLLIDLQTTDEERQLPMKRRGFRYVISELQNELDACVAKLLTSWNDLNLDPLFIYSTENISKEQYEKRIRFLYPVFDNVWLTDGREKDISTELIPFIDYGLVYDHGERRLSVSNQQLITHLNFPELKSSLKAAHVDLEIVNEDAKRVAAVRESGQAAHTKLSETLTCYCNAHEIALEIEEEIVPFMESEEERALRLRKKAEAERLAKREQERKSTASARTNSVESRTSSLPPPIPASYKKSR